MFCKSSTDCGVDANRVSVVDVKTGVRWMCGLISSYIGLVCIFLSPFGTVVHVLILQTLALVVEFWMNLPFFFTALCVQLPTSLYIGWSIRTC